MSVHVSVRDVAHAGASIVAHAAAVVIGFVLMLVGIAMGVTITLLPFAFPVGFCGLGLFLWGLLESMDAHQRRRRAATH